MKGMALCGAGGFCRETLLLLEQSGLAGQVLGLYESDDVWWSREVGGYRVLPLSQLDPYSSQIVLATGDPAVRRRLRADLPDDASFPTLVHPSVQLSRTVDVGPGSIICAGAVVTCNISMGAHVIVDRVATIGHDCFMGDFVTVAPAAVLSGNCVIGADAYIGANAVLRQKVEVAAQTVVGMGAVVVSSIRQPGTYVGCPARPIGRNRRGE
jgi:sugar O-acyltransferase (sialic acid O-acetyltransferase NeuD family)